MIQLLHLSSQWNKFLVSLFISIQSIVSVSGRISPHSFEMFSISPLQPCSFCCWFSNNSVLASVVTVLSQDIVFLRSLHSILTFVPEALWCSSFQPIISFCQRSWSFHAYPFNLSDVSSWQVSSHLVKIMFNSFHLQSECCPNYIILIPSYLVLTGVL